jgi:hypothetical protein
MDQADDFTEVLLPNKQTGARSKQRAVTVPHRSREYLREEFSALRNVVQLPIMVAMVTVVSCKMWRNALDALRKAVKECLPPFHC